MLRLVAKHETPFNYQVYDIYSGTPKNQSFGTADFNSDIKTAFDGIIQELQIIETEE